MPFDIVSPEKRIKDNAERDSTDLNGRVNQGQAVLENMRVRLSDPSIPDGEQAKVYVRPNDITVDRSPQSPTSMAAQVTRINRTAIGTRQSNEQRISLKIVER